jgi:serine/threonine protein kinase
VDAKYSILSSMADSPLLYDRYRVLRKLGSGAFATVYLAEDLKIGRQVRRPSSTTST